MNKRFAFLISTLLIACLLTGALAEEKTEDSMERLWNAFLGFTERAGETVATWTEDAANSLADWLEDPNNAFEKWPENISKWVQDAADSASAFFENADPNEWLRQTSQFFTDAGDEIAKAWDALANNKNIEEARKAYDTLKAWMDANHVDDSIRKAVEGIAKAAGVQIGQ